MILVLDIENSITYKEHMNWKGTETSEIKDMSPYNPNNKLVSVGWNDDPINSDDTEYVFFYHTKHKGSPNASSRLQSALDQCGLLVGHNIKHDLSWLLECGFTYTGPVWDTMVGEFVLARGVKKSFKLEDIAKRRKLTLKKSDVIEYYYKNKITFDNIPPDIVEEYGRGDVVTTTELYRDQLERYNEEHNRGLLPTLKMMCTFTLELVEMERNGMKIDLKALDAVKQEYITEYYELEERLYELAREAVGDTPIQLSSPVFRSKLIYSRRIVNIEDWKRVFVIGMDDKGRVQQKAHYKQTKFNQILKNMTRPVFKTKATHCEECNGKGWVYKETKAGKPFKRHPACRSCVEGVKYVSTGEKAGFGVTPPHSEFTSASGFSTSKEMIGKILSDYHGDEKAKEFLTLYSRFNKIATYLSTFIDGIEKHVQDDGLLHTSLNQAVASTARLSSSSPNLQNQPRGKTFPVRRAFVSRFLLGCISESDYAQLEFRMAGCLSGCPVVFSDTREGVDVHAFTRDTINAFDPRLNQIDRQGAKSDTFKPLYGGKSGTPRQRHYYESFLEKYSGVQSWQEKLLSTACSKRTIVLPTGREYRFGAARRLPSGYVRGTTQIVNWPVQGFATADVVPLGVIAASRLFKKHELKSLLIMTIHDSLVVDVYPGELDQVRELLLEGMLQIPEMMKEFYDIEFDYPLEVGNKFGPNLLETSNEITKQRGYENDNCVGMWRP